HFELHVLLAMLREREETYSVPLVLALEKRMERPVAQAAVFIALSRLEKQGLVTSRLDEPAEGRRRRYFRLTNRGLPSVEEGRGDGGGERGGGGHVPAGGGPSQTRAGGKGRHWRGLWPRWGGGPARGPTETAPGVLSERRGPGRGGPAPRRWLRRQRVLYPLH